MSSVENIVLNFQVNNVNTVKAKIFNLRTAMRVLGKSFDKNLISAGKYNKLLNNLSGELTKANAFTNRHITISNLAARSAEKWAASQAKLNESINKGFKGLHLKEMKAVKDKADNAKKSMMHLQRASLQFNLSMMFMGMQIQRVFDTIAKSSINTFMKISAGATPASKAIAGMGANFEFLKYTIGDALGTALMPLLPIITGLIEGIADFIQQNPEFAAGLLTAGFAAGTLMMTLGQVGLFLGGLKMMLGAGLSDKFIALGASFAEASRLGGTSGLVAILGSLATALAVVVVWGYIIINVWDALVKHGAVIGKMFGVVSGDSRAMSDMGREDMYRLQRDQNAYLHWLTEAMPKGFEYGIVDVAMFASVAWTAMGAVFSAVALTIKGSLLVVMYAIEAALRATEGLTKVKQVSIAPFIKDLEGMVAADYSNIVNAPNKILENLKDGTDALAEIQDEFNAIDDKYAAETEKMAAIIKLEEARNAVLEKRDELLKTQNWLMSQAESRGDVWVKMLEASSQYQNLLANINEENERLDRYNKAIGGADGRDWGDVSGIGNQNTIGDVNQNINVTINGSGDYADGATDATNAFVESVKKGRSDLGLALPYRENGLSFDV